MAPDYLNVLAVQSDAAIAAGRRGDPGAAVPGCPGWTLTDLMWHLGAAQDFWAYVVRTNPAPPADYDDPERPDGHDAVVAWATERSAELRDVLGATDASTKVWTWTTGDDVAWVARRMAHEAAVHRVDAEAATGVEVRLEPELAADGIDEFLAYFLGARFPGAPEPTPIGGSVHLHCTDTEGEWTVADGPDGGYIVRREHDKGDAALRGDAHDLLMALWRRRPIETLTRFGDDSVVDAFLAATRTD